MKKKNNIKQILFLSSLLLINENLFAHDPSMPNKIGYFLSAFIILPISMIVSYFSILIYKIIKSNKNTKGYFIYTFTASVIAGIVGVIIGYIFMSPNYEESVSTIHLIIWTSSSFIGAIIGLFFRNLK